MDLKYSASRVHLYKGMVSELIYFDMIKKCLEIPQEKETKQVFDSIKGTWTEFIEYTSSFVVNKGKLDHKLQSVTIHSHQKEEKEDLLDSSFLLKNNNINMDLLQEALVGHVFEYHCLNYEVSGIDINVLEKTHKNSSLFKLSKLLKKHEKDIPSNDKGKVGYGIKYKIQQNTLSFYGIPEKLFAGRLLLIQILTRQKRIIRELKVLGSEESIKIDNIEEPL